MFGKIPTFPLGGLLRLIVSSGGKWLKRILNVSAGTVVSADRLLTYVKPKWQRREPPGGGEEGESQSSSYPDCTIVFLLGPSGAGKGTQSAFLKTMVPGVTHLSYGDLVRYQDGILGSWVSSLPRRGSSSSSSPIVPADAAARLLGETIIAGAASHGQRLWLLDGFPRTASHVTAWADADMPPARLALRLSCPRETLIRRVLRRAGEVTGRPADANPELVRERVERNEREADALVGALVDAGIPVVEVDANRDVEDVKRDVLAHFQVGVFKTVASKRL